MLSEKLAVFEQNRQALPVGIAPKVFSQDYKPQSKQSKPRSKDWTHRLSSEARLRGASTLKASASSKAATPICNLGVARPVASTIPWSSMTMSLKDYARRDSSADRDAMSCLDGEDDWNLGYALNYGHSAGSPQLLRFITEHVDLVHEPKYEDWATSLSCGNTSALDIILRMLCERGDWLLTEEYTYPGTLEMVKPMGIKLLGIDMDEEGLLPEVLDTKLSNWDDTLGRKPFVLYIIPCGQNPTGATQSLQRRQAIYNVAERHDLIIVEDDPYFFLNLGDHSSAPPSTAEDYLAQLPKSYLRLDRSGRVLRLDATSKILSAGLRAGWVTGSQQLIDQFIYHTEFCTTAVSGPSQIMMYKLLDQTWGHLGFIEWLRKLSSGYRNSRDALIEACERWLPSCCDWNVPTSGMMVWVGVDLSQASENLRRQPNNVEATIHALAVARGLQMSRGSWFAVQPATQSVKLGFRLTFAAAPKESFDAGMKCFRDAVLDALSEAESPISS
ncbi:hypothetical protein CBER1_10162 [Cercospora berteroae]|uniref:Aminotransferase class I/classII large domain-containing protein n=1 Tax=Cercospora berteroae TaxID=357750 RepID=A0A2S6CAS6_9PEZI|nr:hypothetical protein CBER1_10162 [Cercospora berteroae]